MMIYILLAVLNGVVIGTSRAINGRLSMNIGPFKTSLWNHIIGFLFLMAVLITIGGLKFKPFSDIPFFMYLGGFFGALFVAVNSYVFSRIGATKTVILVIGGQMISSVLIDYKSGALWSTLGQLIGVIIILLGIYLSKYSSLRRMQSKDVLYVKS